MKTIITTFILMTCYILTSQAQTTIDIDTKSSIINWKGSMLFSFGGHHGTAKFKEGNLIKTNHKITGGSFIVDMNSLTNIDIEDEKGKTNLLDHLKNEDFFNVEKYPTAKLTITNIEHVDNINIRIKANLTIKNITKPVEFSAKLHDHETLVNVKNKMTAKLKIDRTDWNINYGAKGFVKVKDYAISDAIEFEVEINF